MNSSVVFLLIAFGLSVVGSLLLWVFTHRSAHGPRRQPIAHRRSAVPAGPRQDPPSPIRLLDDE